MQPQKTKKNSFDFLFLGIVLLLVVLLYLKYGFHQENEKEKPSAETPTMSQDEEVAEPDVGQLVKSEPARIPLAHTISVPFTSQAPLSVWDALHEDACEEASLLMLWHWKNNTTISAAQADKDIVKMVEYETNHGYGGSIILQELASIAQDYLSLGQLRVVPALSTKDIRKAIAAGSPVIVGAAGKLLPNPNFRNGGPNYHMLLIKGYDENGFITNDPGTRKGESYYYTDDELWNSIHDWNDQDILKGEKNMLFLEP